MVDTITFGSGSPTIDSSLDEIHFGGGGTGAPKDLPYSVGVPAQADTGPTLEDHLHNLYGAGWQAVGAVRRGIAQMQPDDGSRKNYDAFADEANLNARQHLEAMTPSGRDTAQRWNSHWIQGALMGAEQQFPALAAAGIGEAVAGPAAGPAVYGALSAGQAAENFYSAIREMPIDTLMKNPDFANLASHMSEDDARAQFAHQHVNDAEQMLVGAVTGAGVGALGPVAKLYGRGLFGAPSQSILRNMATAGAESSGSIAVQSGLMDITQQHALQNLNLPAKSTSEILEDAFKQAIPMGALGALGGMRRGPTPPKPIDMRQPWQTPNVKEGQFQLPSPEQRLALPAPPIYARDESRQYPRSAWPREENEPIEVPPTATQRAGDLFDQIQELRDLHKRAREDGGDGGGGGGGGDKSEETAQTPSAPLRSAQAAPVMPDQGHVTTDEGKEQQAQQRRAQPVAGENVSVRSPRDKYAKPRAGGGDAETGERAQEAPSIPSSPNNADQTIALQSSLEIQPPTIDSRLQKALDSLRRLPQDQQVRFIQNLREQGGEHSDAIADMLEQSSNLQRPDVQRGNVQESIVPSSNVNNVQPEPAVNARAPSLPASGNEPSQATPLPAPPPETGPAPVPAPALTGPTPAIRAPLAPEPPKPIVQSPPVDLSGTAARIHEALQEEPIKEIQPGHKPEWQKKARDINNTKADKIIDNHKPPAGKYNPEATSLLPDSQGGKGALVALRARLTAMVKEADEEKINIPKSFRKAPEGGSDHSPSVVLLDEARRFLDYTKGKLKEEDRIEAAEQFLGREAQLRKGEYGDILKERSEQAERVKSAKGEIPTVGEKAVEQEKLDTLVEKKEGQLSIVPKRLPTPYEELVHKERLVEAKERLDAILKKYSDALKVAGKVDPKHLEELKANADEAIKAMEELGFDAPKGYKISGDDVYSHLREAGEQGEDKEGVTVHDWRTNSPTAKQEVKAKPAEVTNIRDLLSKHVNLKEYKPAFRGMMKILVNKLIDFAGDTPVHIFDTDEWLKFMDKRDHGIYDHDLKQIGLHRDYSTDTHSIVHEAFHAATQHAFETSPEFKRLVTKLYNEIAQSPNARLTQDTQYAMLAGAQNPVEMLTELMSNPHVQEAFKRVPISSELAKELGIPEFRKASFFKTILDGLLEALGFDRKYYPAIEAAAALSEKAIGKQYPSEAAKFDRRLRKAMREEGPTTDSQPIGLKLSSYTTDEIPKKWKEISKDIIDKLKYEPQSAILRLKQWFDTPREWGVQMENKGHFKGSFRQWLEHMSRQGYERTKFIKQFAPLVKTIATLGVKKPQEFTKLVNLLLSAARHGAHPDDPLFEGRNAFLRPTNNQHWEAIAGHTDDRADYLAMDKGTQEIFRNIRDAMQDIHKKDMTAARDSLIKSYRKYAKTQGEDFLKVFEKVAADKELTAKEEEEHGSDPYLQDIFQYNRMIGRDADQMFYFPMQRTAWKYAITGTHNYNIPKNAKRDPSGEMHRYIFDNPSDAYAFTRDVGLPSYRETKYYFEKPDGTRDYASKSEVRQTPEGTNITPDKKEHHVVVNPEHTEFANSVTEGERIREAMAKIPTMNKGSISGVMPVEDQALKRYGFYGPQVEAMKNRVGKLDHLTTKERDAAQDAIDHAAISSMRGNYLPQNLLPRRRIMGTDNIDIIKSFASRVRASANFQTMAAHRNEIDDAMQAMKDEVKNNRWHKDITEMQSFVNMIQNRTMNYATDALDDLDMSTLMHHVQSFGVIKYLASPAFLAYHQLHVPLVVVPSLAKHIGWFPAFRMALKTYRQMLGGMPVIGKGIAGGFKRAMDYDREPTDFVDALMSELKKYGGTEDELRAMQYAVENDIMHHTGINFSSYFKGMSQIERFEQRAMNISAEIIGSADAVNRFNSMLMFYRAARDKMGIKDETKAFQWAADRVAETQGQFTAFNRVGLMRSPNIRAVMQFKSFPLILMKTITKAMYNSLRWGASKEERIDAIKTLAGLMGASMAISGVQGAVPEPIEDINNVLSALGLTNTWDQYEDKLRTYVADNIGSNVATMIMNGPIGGGLGVDLTHRGGISELTGLARLHVTKPQDLENAMFKWMSGVPGSILGDGIDGMNAMETGDLEGMMKGFLPRVITDPLKAYQMYNQGVTTRAGKVISAPLGLPDVLKQALGLAPLTASHAREARYVIGEEKGEEQQERSRIEKLYTSGNKGDAIRAMNKFNKDKPSEPLKLSDLQRAQKETSHKKVLGYDTKKHMQEYKKKAQEYGVPQ